MRLWATLIGTCVSYLSVAFLSVVEEFCKYPNWGRNSVSKIRGLVQYTSFRVFTSRQSRYNLSRSPAIILMKYLLFFCLLGTQLSSITIGSAPNEMQINHELFFFKDVENNLTIEKALALPQAAWNRVKKTSFGQSAARYWFYVDLQNPSTHDIRLVLDVSYATLESVNLYYPDANGEYRELKNGSVTRREDRQIP